MSSKKNENDRVKEQPVTYEIYADMPDDGQRYEVLDGQLELMSPGTSMVHQIIGSALHLLVQSCISDYIILFAPLDVILSKTNVVQPDLVMLHRSRSDIATNRGIEGAPDLVVEVLSPGSRKRDRVRKSKIYEKHEVPEYWIIDPEARTLERLALNGDRRYEVMDVYENDELVASVMLPCVSFAVSDLFRDEVVQRLL